MKSRCDYNIFVNTSKDLRQCLRELFCQSIRTCRWLRNVVSQLPSKKPRVEKGFLRDLWIRLLPNGVKPNKIHKRPTKFLRHLH